MHRLRIRITETATTRSAIMGASIVVLLLALSGCRGEADSRLAPAPTVELLKHVIVAHYHAIEDNRLDEAMIHYHSQSPEVVQTRKDIELGLSQFLLKTTTMTFCYDGQENEFATATARHRYLVITGVKFVERFADVTYQLREERGAWKIWTKKDAHKLGVKNRHGSSCFSSNRDGSPGIQPRRADPLNL